MFIVKNWPHRAFLLIFPLKWRVIKEDWFLISCTSMITMILMHLPTFTEFSDMKQTQYPIDISWHVGRKLIPFFGTMFSFVKLKSEKVYFFFQFWLIVDRHTIYLWYMYEKSKIQGHIHSFTGTDLMRTTSSIITSANSGEGYVFSCVCMFVCVFVFKITQKVVDGL